MRRNTEGNSIYSAFVSRNIFIKSAKFNAMTTADQIEDQSFSAHRIVLASTIPYFYAMFTHNMAESRIKEITMKEIEPQ